MQKLCIFMFWKGKNGIFIQKLIPGTLKNVPRLATDHSHFTSIDDTVGGMDNFCPKIMDFFSSQQLETDFIE